MSGGGSGGSGTQKYEWNENMAPHWANALEWGKALTDPNGAGRYQKYPGQKIAFMNQDQGAAMDAVRHFVGSSGSPTTKAADGSTYQTLTGHFLNGPGANPYAGQENKFSGSNPYFNQVLDIGQKKIVDKYQQGTAADTERAFQQAGAFGGSAHKQTVANNQGALVEGLGNYTAGMQNDQYQRSAGLEENRLGRASGAFEGERGRMMGAIPLGNQQQQLAFDRYKTLMGVGDINRSYQQDFLNQEFQDWQDSQNQQFKMLDFYTGLLGRAQGGVAPNMTTTQSGYRASPFSQLLGGGLAAYGLMS